MCGWYSLDWICSLVIIVKQAHRPTNTKFAANSFVCLVKLILAKKLRGILVFFNTCLLDKKKTILIFVMFVIFMLSFLRKLLFTLDSTSVFFFIILFLLFYTFFFLFRWCELAKEDEELACAFLLSGFWQSLIPDKEKNEDKNVS